MCMCVCVYVYIYIYIYIHFSTWIQACFLFTKEKLLSQTLKKVKEPPANIYILYILYIYIYIYIYILFKKG